MAASTWRTIVGTAFVTVPITVTFVDMLGYVAKVEGASMQPCLNPEDSQSKDYVFLNRWAGRTCSYKHGDVVSLKSPTNPDQKLIKRIIAMEGDTVKTLGYRNRFVKLVEGHCWVEGDHHGHSLDSNLFGPVSMALITAKASHIVWPPSRWQRIASSTPDNRINVSVVTAHSTKTNGTDAQHKEIDNLDTANS